MDQKNLMSQVVRPVNPTTTGELPAPELAQLSEEDLQQIIGGSEVELTLNAVELQEWWVE
jgi:bacteriocin-like protein